MERTYTEAELRQRIKQKAWQISKGWAGRLQDDGIFKSYPIKVKATLEDDGSYTLDSGSFNQILSELLPICLTEYVNELLIAMFEEDDATDLRP